MSSTLPHRLERLLRRAEDGLARADFGAADSALAEAEHIAPEHPGILLLRGRRLRLAGYAPEAAAFLRGAIEHRPEDASLCCELGLALRESGDAPTAYAALLRACELDPASPEHWFHLAALFRDGAYPERALDALNRALALKPDYAEAVVAHADVARMLGRIDEAAAGFRRAIAIDRRSADAWFGLANLKTVRLTDEEVAALETLAANSGGDVEPRIRFGFALAAALEDRHEFDRAFEVVAGANRLKRATVDWDAAAFSAQIDDALRAFARAGTESSDPTLGESVVFVVSLPRSGSSLVEQILASHPRVEGAGELPDLSRVVQEETRRRGSDITTWAADADPEEWRRMGTRYLELTQRWRRNRPVMVDKGLSNWTIAGAALAMLPAARVVEIRRDPLETCWSCYRQLFRNASHFSYDLDDLAAFWRDYDRLMRFWHQRHPERMLALRYEDLQADPETWTRRLLDHCGLDFDPACLAFERTERQVRTESAAQVRTPLRRDTARAHRYAAQLTPLRRALGIEP